MITKKNIFAACAFQLLTFTIASAQSSDSANQVIAEPIINMEVVRSCVIPESYTREPTVIYLVTMAQYFNLPLDYSFSLFNEKTLSGIYMPVHTGVKPYIHFFGASAADGFRDLKFNHRFPRYIFSRPVISIAPEKENFRLKVCPLLNIEYGKDLSAAVDRNLYNNTRGFIASGVIGKKFYFESLLAENQSMFPDYISNNVNFTQVVPGQGRWKPFKVTGYDYAFSSGFISMQVLKNLNIQLGHGKQKIGNGYRSLLLSDNAFNYPYARITQEWFKGKLQYNNIYAVLMNLEPAAVKQNPAAERLFQKKAASFQYLSINLGKRLNFGLFQGLIWQAGDARNQQHLNWQYFNPLIYTNLLSYQLNNKNNLLIGADFKLKISSKFNVYGQLMADDLSNTRKSGNGWGVQGGFKYFDAFGLKNLFLQAEINSVSESSYVSPIGTTSNQSYSHYNQNLAYTPGNGKELVAIVDYKLNRWFTTFKYNYQSTYLNSADYYKVNILNAKVGFIINPSYNLNINIGINYRMQNFYTFNVLNNETNYIYVGFKTSLYNLYYDF